MTRAALLIAVCIAQSAAAHEWYDPWCCFGKDCRPITAKEKIQILKDGSAFVWRDGVRYHIPQMAPDGIHRRVSPSRDWQNHVCILPGQDEPRCVYFSSGF